MERVVVLGSNSFSGSDFVDLLLERGGYEVHGVSRSPEKSGLFLPYVRREGAPFTFHRLDLNGDGPRLRALLDELQPAFGWTGSGSGCRGGVDPRPGLRS